MVNLSTILGILAMVCIAFVSGKIESNRWITTGSSVYLYPIDVCVAKQFGVGRFNSHKFVCESEECCEEDENGNEECFEDCNRIVRKFAYNDVDCTGKAYFVDKFEHSNAQDYPFNCYEEAERDAMDSETGISEAADPANYAPSYMIVRLSLGMSKNVTVVNATNTTDEVVEETCTKDPDSTFYRSFAAVTNLCYSRQMRWDDRPYWYYAQCDEDTIYVGKFNSSTCNDSTEVSDGRFPLLKDNGCKLNEKWKGDYWYSEVVECSHVTEGLSAAGVRNMDNKWISIIFGIVVVVYNMLMDIE